MTRDAQHFVTLAGLTGDRATRVRVAEPPETSAHELWEQLLAGTYDKPVLVEDDEHRSLVFTVDGNVQSEMRLDDPAALVNEYTRKMMAFLLFVPRPQHAVMIGLGGGSLVKFCRKHLPQTRLTVVEIDASVIALREQFAIPPDDAWQRVVHADGAVHVAAMARAGERAEVLLVDAYDRRGLARSVASWQFLEHARRVLGDDGILVMNLAAFESNVRRMHASIRCVFGGPVLSVQVGWGGNTIVFAGQVLRDAERLAAVSSRAQQVQEELDLKFRRLPRLVSEYLRDAQVPHQDAGTAQRATVRRGSTTAARASPATDDDGS